MFTLVSSDGEQFEVEREVCRMSTLIKRMGDVGPGDSEIPLPNVKAAVLAKVVEYCKTHFDKPAADVERPLRGKKLADAVGEEDAEFVNVDQELLCGIILAANYLDIKPLLDLGCAKIASMLRGKTPEEIRETFNVTNDFTPEEEAQVREENRWCDDDDE